MSDTDRAKMNWMLPPDLYNWRWEDETPLVFAHRMVEAAEEVERLRLKIENIRWYVCDRKKETPDEIAERTKNWTQDARGTYRGGPW